MGKQWQYCWPQMDVIHGPRTDPEIDGRPPIMQKDVVSGFTIPGFQVTWNKNQGKENVHSVLPRDGLSRTRNGLSIVPKSPVQVSVDHMSSVDAPTTTHGRLRAVSAAAPWFPWAWWPATARTGRPRNEHGPSCFDHAVLYCPRMAHG